MRWKTGVVLALGSAASVGIGTAVNPTLTVGAAAVGGIAVLVVIVGARLVRLFLVCLGVLLVGYALFGRGFAYLGYYPVYIGEVVLALGMIAGVAGARMGVVRRSPVCWLLIAYATWGAIRTVPSLGTHGLDALRDAVIWGYGAYALLVATMLSQGRLIWAVIDRYRTWLPFLLLWMPAALLATRFASDAVPRILESPVPVLAVKPGDAAVHLAGALAFLGVGLYGERGNVALSPTRFDTWILSALWLVGFIVAGSTNRGGLLATLVVTAVVLSLRPAWLLRLSAIAVLLTSIFLAADVDVDLGNGRVISPEQIIENVQSVVAPDEADPNLVGTAEWRLAWWSRIIDYTVFGEYFWTGKGFGVNLADDDGFQVTPDRSLRSPHNSHLTVLARAGAPGMALWLLLQGAFAASLVLAYVRALRLGLGHWAQLNLWLLCYWTAFVVNGLFDVFLEGPQGGIWFWSLFGFGIAALDAQHRGDAADGGEESSEWQHERLGHPQLLPAARR